MRHILSILFSFGCALHAFAAVDTNAPPLVTNTAPAVASLTKKTFESFKIIAEHNIFNPNRTAHGARNTGDGESRRVRTESFTLVGTMLYGDKQLAFFDSSSSSYKKTVKSGDSVANYKVSEVTPAGVTLEKDGKILKLAVGEQMKKPDGGDWAISGERTPETNNGSATSDTSSSSDSNTGSSNDASSSSGGSDEDAVLQRLLKRREEEMKK